MSEYFINKTIGPYLIIDKIGQGGMGVVFKARHEKLGRVVALKMLASHLAENPEMRARFLREAKLQANFVHPNVVNLFDYIEENNNVFLVMEYIDGETLEQMLLKRRCLSVAEAFYVARGVLDALMFMHKHGVIHRDIKPSNIMVSSSGHVKVTDFGIARLADDEHSITRTGVHVGTLYYMAPEVLSRGEISPAADIYSLGVMLFQLLSGRLPFTGRTDYEVMTAHLRLQPPSIREFNPEVPVDLERVVLRALAKDPEERFATAAEFREAIDSAFEKWKSPSGGKEKKLLRPFVPDRNLFSRKTLFYVFVFMVLAVLAFLVAVIWKGRESSQKPILPARLEPAVVRSAAVSGTGGSQKNFITMPDVQKSVWEEKFSTKKEKSDEEKDVEPASVELKPEESKPSVEKKQVLSKSRKDRKKAGRVHRSSSSSRKVTGWSIRK